MATQQAHEAKNSHKTLAVARASYSRPHLVTGAERVANFRESEAHESRDSASDVQGRSLRVLETNAPAINVTRNRARDLRTAPIYSVFKRVLDILGATFLGLIFSPLILIIVLLMKRDGGSIIYRHRRIGRGGQVFECLKFRTMIPNADQVLWDLLEQNPELKAEWVRDHKLRNDPRITPIGRFLRRTSLDELPQLWNVIRGEMSLVGPRPVVREELMRYGRNLAYYLSTRPGITGLWQVTGRNDTNYRRRVALDVCYVRNQNLLLDLFILLKTTRVVLGGGGAY